MKKLIVLIALFALILVAAPVASATVVEQPKVEQCGAETTYTKEGDYDNSKVNINFQDSDEAITITAKTGYKIVKVELNVDNDNQAGFVVYPVVDSVKFNPNPGNDIQVAKVTVAKTCTPACTDPAANNTGEVVEGQTVEDNTVCTFDPEPVATPSAEPKVETPTTLPDTGFPVKEVVVLGVLAVAAGWAVKRTLKG